MKKRKKRERLHRHPPPKHTTQLSTLLVLFTASIYPCTPVVPCSLFVEKKTRVYSYIYIIVIYNTVKNIKITYMR